MTTGIIVTICLLLLLAYIFDISSSRIRVPSVILLLLGWTLKKGSEVFGIFIPELNFLLPVLGTIGLILIVLEGSLELEINRSKSGIITKSLINALIPMVVLAFFNIFQRVRKPEFLINF